MSTKNGFVKNKDNISQGVFVMTFFLVPMLRLVLTLVVQLNHYKTPNYNLDILLNKYFVFLNNPFFSPKLDCPKASRYRGGNQWYLHIYRNLII